MRCLIIFLIIISGNVFSQNYIKYNNLINEADYRLISTKEYEKAEKIYLDAFKLEKPFERDYFQLARCYAALGDSIAMIKYLKLSSTSPAFNPLLYMKMKKDSILFAKYVHNESFKSFLKETKELKEKHKEILKNDINYKQKRDTIHYFLNIFQQNHKELQENIKKLTINQKDSMERIIEVLDINMRKSFFKYVEANGFPDYVVPGSNFTGGDFISLFLTKLTDKEFEKYNPILLKELNKGNLTPYNYAFIVDKVKTSKQKNKCLYYSQAKSMKEDCWETAIEERKKIGLSIYLDGSPQNITMGFNKKLPWVGIKIN
jgi:hypothetical protein